MPFAIFSDRSLVDACTSRSPISVRNLRARRPGMAPSRLRWDLQRPSDFLLHFNQRGLVAVERNEDATHNHHNIPKSSPFYHPNRPIMRMPVDFADLLLFSFYELIDFVLFKVRPNCVLDDIEYPLVIE